VITKNENQDQVEFQQDDLYEHYKIVVDKGQLPLRIDKFLTDRLPNTSRNKIQNAAIAGSILTNEKSVKSNYKVKPGDIVQLVLPYPRREIELVPDDIPLEIVYEDDYLVIINKQSNLVVHPGYGNYRGTLVNGLIHHFDNLPALKKPHEDSPRPGLVHRLDKNTTGLMVIAKEDLALTHLAKQFFDRTVERTYVALVWGDLEEGGTITGHVGRNLKNRKLMHVFPNGDNGKHAVTHFKVLERFGYVTLVECKLETGRTHQIRVHFKYLGHPLFGDNEYGGDIIVKGLPSNKYNQFVNNCFQLLGRQALHAKSLGFIHPNSKEHKLFENEIPQDIEAVLTRWRTYSTDQLNKNA